MANSSAAKPKRPRKTAETVGGYRVLGTTSDGIRILKPPGRSTHFTIKQMRDAIKVVRAAQKAE